MSDPGPSSSMLHKASNSTCDTFNVELNYNLNTQGENRALELHDAIVHLLHIVPPFLAEVRKNACSRSTVSDTTVSDGSDLPPQSVSTDNTPQTFISEGDIVEISDIVRADLSSLPVSSIADSYTRSMLECLRGYPLYNPKPLSELSKDYLRHGVNVGDVGFVRGTGTFDFLFNICPSRNGLINPPNLPDGFSLETPYDSGATELEPLPRNTCFFKSPITKTRSGEYICEGPEGAILELPEGAIRDEALNMLPLKNLAAHRGVEWYKYTMSRGRDISNGALYLITSLTKCTQWGIAVFDRPCASGQGLTFDSETSFPSKYRWKGSDVFTTKVANHNRGDASNQCVFLQGYKIMIRQDIFDKLSKDQLRASHTPTPSLSPDAGSSSMTQPGATHISGGGGPDLFSRLTGAGLLSRTTMMESDKVVLHPSFNLSLIHPSDFINATLLSQNPGAKVALTHDDVWCNLLHDNFPKFNHATLINIAQSYTSIVDKYGCILLEKTCDLGNVLDESSCPVQGTETPALQESAQGVRDILVPSQAPTALLLHTDTVTILGQVALAYRDQGWWGEAEGLQVLVMELSKEIFGAFHPHTLSAMHNLALTYSDQRKWMEAESLLVKVMEASKEILGTVHPHTLFAMDNLAATYSYQGRWQEAESLQVKVMEANKEILVALHPDTLTSMCNLAATYRNQGRWREVESLQVQVVEARKEILGALHPDTLTAMRNLAATYRNQGRWREVESLQVQVMEARMEILGTLHPDTLIAMANLATTYKDQEMWWEAESLQIQVVEARKEILGALHPQTLSAMANLALIHSGQDSPNEAKELLETSIKGMQQVLGLDHPTTIHYMQVLTET